MRIGRGIACSLLGLCLGISGAWALMERNNAPAPLEDEILDRLIGQWTLSGTLYGPDGTPGAFTGTDSCRWVAGHQFVMNERVITPKGDVPQLENVEVFRFDPKAGAFSVWTFTSRGTFSKRSGKCQGDTLTLEGEGPMGTSRTTMTIPAKGDPTFKLEIKALGSDSYSPHGEGTGKRKGA